VREIEVNVSYRWFLGLLAVAGQCRLFAAAQNIKK
jgi:hypothetical protein